MTELPEWVQTFNKRKRAADFVGKTWDRMLDGKYYLNPDEGPGEANLGEEKKPVFPHKVAHSKDNFDAVISSPFGNQLLVEFAEAALEGEKLGQRDKPDLLCVSFSSIDYVGHKFGPYSQEVQDMVLRLDRQLNDFFNYLEQKVGLENLVVTLTADHAVAPTIEFAKAEGFNAEGFDENGWVGDLKTRLNEEFGPGRYILGSKVFTGQMYLDRGTLERKKISLPDITSIVREFALASGKYQAVFSRDQLLEGRAPGPLGELAINGYNAERGGDLVLIPKPYVIPGAGKTGTTHGSAYAYDTHVPILFYGQMFKPGQYADDFHITDIVPTLCAGLGMNEPAGSMGKPLRKILSKGAD